MGEKMYENIKVKEFWDNGPAGDAELDKDYVSLEKRINDWLTKNKVLVVDIKYVAVPMQTDSDSDPTYAGVGALIIYKENK